MTTTSRHKPKLQTVWTQAWDHGAVEALDELLSPAYERRSAAGGTTQNRSQFKRSIITVRAAFPDLRTEIEELLEEDDRVAVRWRSTGTHTGTFLEVPPTTRRVQVNGVTFARFRGETVESEWVTWDPRQLLTALGIIPLDSAATGGHATGGHATGGQQ